MSRVALLMPAVSPGCTSMSSVSKPRRSAQRLYMRNIMSAQSFDSVPPAPAWIEKMALLRSNCPVRNAPISRSSSSASMLVACVASSAPNSACSSSEPTSINSFNASRSPMRLRNASTGSTARLRALTLPMWRWARSLLSQKVGSPICASSASISRSFCSASRNFQRWETRFLMLSIWSKVSGAIMGKGERKGVPRPGRPPQTKTPRRPRSRPREQKRGLNTGRNQPSYPRWLLPNSLILAPRRLPLSYGGFRVFPYPMLVRALCLLFLALGPGPGLARAHLPLESTLVVDSADAGREINAVLSEPLARALLSPPPEGRLVGELFEQNRSRLLSAAAQVCTLLDAKGQPLKPAKVQVALNPEGEVHFLIAYDANARPASLRAEFLGAAPPAAFVMITDRSSGPPRHAVLMRGRVSHAFAAPPPAAP